MNKNHKKYLTVHGHFYQPPRENPWLEEIEYQEGARPYHNWNDRISNECYGPNSISRIVDDKNRILNIVNNYELMSFNFGPTLLSWMAKYSRNAYKKILEADKFSRAIYEGHSNAISQVYNHVIMPLANEKDKITQVIWGIKDYKERFGHKPEGMWLAETAVDDETLEVLADNGIKFTILSPHQAQCVRKIGDFNWHDVSWGSIDPSMPYRHYFDETQKKYIDIFFYDGSISKSVAFDNLLEDGEKFAFRLNNGYDENRQRPQLVNISTDGESYGHHTKFGDMALSYVLTIKAKDLDFEITNYGWFLEKFPPKYEVEIKPESSWSCCHGIGRWCEDCGCSTGEQPGWNQKWRAPLRKALDYLRDELIILCQIEGSKYFKDFWKARNSYIDIILNRTQENIDKFLSIHAKKKLSPKEKINAIKLLEIQRQALLMYTSCGWFFAEISGIETIQILKYAARAMEIAKDFTKQDYEKKFLNILQKAQSNLSHLGNGKDIYNKFVKKSVITVKQIVGHWAISSLVEDFKEIEQIYCYKLKKISHKVVHKNGAALVFGRVEITSCITFEKHEMVFAAVGGNNGNIYCVVKEFEGIEKFSKDKQDIEKVFLSKNDIDMTNTLKKHFSEEFYTLKEVLIDRRKIILEKILSSKIQSLEETYGKIYEDMRISVVHLMDLGMDLPDVFRLSAKYTIGKQLENLLLKSDTFEGKKFVAALLRVKAQADVFCVNLNRSNAGDILNKKLEKSLMKLVQNFKIEEAKEILAVFNTINLLNLDIKISNAQNIYFENIYKKLDILINDIDSAPKRNKDEERLFGLILLAIGENLNINTSFYRAYLDKASLPK